MAEWHISAVDIMRDWSDELLTYMLSKLRERRHREASASEKNSGADKRQTLLKM